MKRPETRVFYAPVPGSTDLVLERLSKYFLQDLDGSLAHYFARLEWDQQESEYDLVDETLDLDGAADLLSRVKQMPNCMCKFRAPMRFANGDIYLGLWSTSSGEANVLLEIDPAITRFIERDEQTRIPFVSFLGAVGAVLNSDWFVGGLQLPWRDIQLDNPKVMSECLPKSYFVGWQDDAPIGAPLGAYLKKHKREIQAVASGYYVSLLF